MMGFDASGERLFRGHRSTRLLGCDYTAPGFYFVTICTHQRKCVLSCIRESDVQLSRLGTIVNECWRAIPDHFTHAQLHEFVIMPNHLHAIVRFCAKLGRSGAAPLRSTHDGRVRSGSLAAVVRSFKAIVTKRARMEAGWTGELWQRNYFERILRDGKEMAAAAAYIVENPRKWEWDCENLIAEAGQAARGE